MPDMHASTMSEPWPATVSSCSAGKIQKHCTCTSMSTSRCKGLSFTYAVQTDDSRQQQKPTCGMVLLQTLRLQDRSCATAHRNKKELPICSCAFGTPRTYTECSSEYLQSPIASTCRITFTSSGSQPGSRQVLDSVDDPSAGSPTETLLRLLLPVSHKIHETSQRKVQKLSTAAVLITGSLNQ